MALDAGLGGLLLLVGRLLFGGMLLWMGWSNLKNGEAIVGYAQASGVPVATALVPFASGMLALGSLGIVLGVYPVIAAAMVAAFLLGVTPTMHAFWTIDTADERQQELIAFQKNAALFGSALALFVLGGETWAYALNVGF